MVSPECIEEDKIKEVDGNRHACDSLYATTDPLAPFYHHNHHLPVESSSFIRNASRKPEATKVVLPPSTMGTTIV